MTDLHPHTPHRPLLWPEIIFDLQDTLAGDPHPVYVVGGAVRDALLHRPLKDIDLVTSESAIQMARRIANQFNGAFYKLDSERDVGRALLDTPAGQVTIDVARLRDTTLLDDLLDRDFTINAMVADLRGDLALLIDPLNGEADLRKKLIRQCKADSMANDPIRTLRAVRLAVQLSLHIEKDTQQAVRQAAPHLNQSSPERRRDEFFRILALHKPAAGLRVAESLGLLPSILPEGVGTADDWKHTLAVVETLDRMLGAISYSRSDNTAASFGLGILVMQLDRFRGKLVNHLEASWPNERPHRALLMLATLLLAVPESAEAAADNLRLSNQEQTRLALLIRHHNDPLTMGSLTARSIHRYWRLLGAAGVDVCLLALAAHLGSAGVQLEQDAWLAQVERAQQLLSAYFEQYETLIEPTPLLNGSALMEVLGMGPGPLVGELVNLIREAQAAGEIHTADAAIALAQNYLKKRL